MLTGREPAAWMQDAADYSTELRAVKHPYTRGIAAREALNTDTYGYRKGPAAPSP